jgi:signal transduction histidine kinase
VVLALALGSSVQVAALAWDAWQFSRLGAQISAANDVYLPLSRACTRMEGLAERQDRARLLGTAGDARKLATRAQLEATGEERAHLNAVVRQLDDIVAAKSDTVKDEIQQLSTLADGRISATSARAARAQRQAVRVAVMLAVLAPVLAAVVLWVAGGALRPVERLTAQVRRMAAGEAPVPVQVGGGDEIAALAQAFAQLGTAVEERDRARERLQRSERLALVGQLLAQVTHEVRNPLNAVSLHAELLGEEPLTDEARALLATITRELRRLEGVTERYLDLARRRDPELSTEDPVELAQEVVALEDEVLRRAEVAVEVRGPGGVRVEIDGNRVRRALLNLLRNAAEAGAHQIVVEVTLDAAQVAWTVSDDGPGIPPDVLDRLFDPFFTTKARGTGLGLAVTRQGIEDLGGTVTAACPAGGGARFEVRLPVHSRLGA